MKGKIKFDYKLENGSPKQELEIEIKRAPANMHYQLMVDFGDGNVDFGTLSTNNQGCAELEFYSSPEFNQRQITDFLPPGRDVRNIHRIQIFLKGKSVFEARFQFSTNDTR
jgi:hypothetical protein